MMENNLKVIQFTSSMANSDGEPVKGTERNIVVMFNCTQIAAEEVNKLIQSGMYEYDQRVVVLTPTQYNYLKNKES